MNPAAFRKQAIIVLIIAILLVLGSMWVNMVLKKTAIKDKPEVQRTDPDYIIENFKYYRFLIYFFFENCHFIINESVNNFKNGTKTCI